MPYKDPEKSKQYHKEYREKNKEKKKEYNKQYNIDNFEKVKIYKAQYNKQYYEKNRNKLLEQKKEYGQTEKGIKVYRICEWKRTGLICDDIDSLYEYYINTTHCEHCGVELFNGKKTISTKKNNGSLPYYW